jgi:hypothetical protein
MLLEMFNTGHLADFDINLEGIVKIFRMSPSASQSRLRIKL